LQAAIEDAEAAGILVVAASGMKEATSLNIQPSTRA
jgi:hypothetical protein